MSEKADKNDFDYEISFYENLLKKKPDFVEAISALADLYTKKGLYDRGLVMDEKLMQYKPDDPLVLYNLACSYSLVNNLDKALVTIKRAIECGYNNFKYLERDQDLFNLRNDQRFKKYIKNLQKPDLKKSK